MGLSGKKVNTILLAICFACLASAGTSRADEYHYNTTAIGERPTGMAGAYTAISDDASGLYYNPAGIVYSPGSNLSASVNSYSTLTKKYQNAIGGYDYVRKSENLQPNFFGVIQHTPFGTVGFSYAIPDTMMEGQDQTLINPNSSISSYTINFNKEYNVYNLGPSIGVELTNDLKIGATLYFHYRRQKTTNNIMQTLASSGQVVLTNSLYKLEETGFRPILGVLWSPESAKYSVGFTLSQTMVYDSAQYSQSATNFNFTTQSFVSLTSPSVTRTAVLPQYPVVAKLGVAYFPSNALLVSADITYNSAVSADTAVYTWDRTAVTNFAIGAEYYLRPTLALRAGVNSDISNAPNLSQANEKVDLYGLSFSGTWFSKSTSLTLGMTDSFGTGTASIVGSSTQPLSVQAMTVFMGTSYSY